MASIAVAAIAFVCIFGGAVLGMFLRALLPDNHLSADSKDVVKMAMGLVATMAALVLGLLTASAKGEFDLQTGELQQAAAKIIQLDRALANYGPEAGPLRDALKRLIAFRLQVTWPEEGAGSAKDAPGDTFQPGEHVLDGIHRLAPQTDTQRESLSTAMQISRDLLSARWLMFAQAASPLPRPFLVMLVLWLSVLFGSFGLFAPRNATVLTALLICAIAVASSIFLILEMNQPLAGLIKISSAPLRYALSQLGH